MNLSQDTDPSNMSLSRQVSVSFIVAATKSMGIGNKGGLPWPQLKEEMAYFARVTKHVPSNIAGTPQNAVIMGRKTWDSIPEKFRPLKGRINVVVSQSITGATDGKQNTGGANTLFCTSLEAAVQTLEHLSASGALGRAFIIGGASLYSEALQKLDVKHILLTRIKKEFECDTHFPLDPSSPEAVSEGWSQKSAAQLGDFIGESMDNPTKVEGDVEYEFCLFEKDVDRAR